MVTIGKWLRRAPFIVLIVVGVATMAALVAVLGFGFGSKPHPPPIEVAHNAPAPQACKADLQCVKDPKLDP